MLDCYLKTLHRSVGSPAVHLNGNQDKILKTHNIHDALEENGTNTGNKTMQ